MNTDAGSTSADREHAVPGGAYRRLQRSAWRRDDGAYPVLDEERRRLRGSSVRRPRPRSARIGASIERWARAQRP